MQDLATEDMARIVSRVTEPALGMALVPATASATDGDDGKDDDGSRKQHRRRRERTRSLERHDRRGEVR